MKSQDPDNMYYRVLPTDDINARQTKYQEIINEREAQIASLQSDLQSQISNSPEVGENINAAAITHQRQNNMATVIAQIRQNQNRLKIEQDNQALRQKLIQFIDSSQDVKERPKLKSMLENFCKNDLKTTLVDLLSNKSRQSILNETMGDRISKTTSNIFAMLGRAISGRPTDRDIFLRIVENLAEERPLDNKNANIGSFRGYRSSKGASR